MYMCMCDVYMIHVSYILSSNLKNVSSNVHKLSYVVKHSLYNRNTPVHVCIHVHVYTYTLTLYMYITHLDYTYTCILYTCTCTCTHIFNHNYMEMI